MFHTFKAISTPFSALLPEPMYCIFSVLSDHAIFMYCSTCYRDVFLYNVFSSLLLMLFSDMICSYPLSIVAS